MGIRPGAMVGIRRFMLVSMSFLNTDASRDWELGDEVGIAGQVVLSDALCSGARWRRGWRQVTRRKLTHMSHSTSESVLSAMCIWP